MVIRINYNNLYFHTSYTIPARYPLNPGARAATTQSIRDHPVTALRCKDTYVGALTYPYNRGAVAQRLLATDATIQISRLRSALISINQNT